MMGILTDNTLSKDVLPAFWSPIMVTSISVALSISVSALMRYRLAELAHLGVVTARRGPRRAMRTRTGGL